jgi:hypothetical protein
MRSSIASGLNRFGNWTTQFLSQCWESIPFNQGTRLLLTYGSAEAFVRVTAAEVRQGRTYIAAARSDPYDFLYYRK